MPSQPVFQYILMLISKYFSIVFYTFIVTYLMLIQRKLVAFKVSVQLNFALWKQLSLRVIAEIVSPHDIISDA